MSTVLEPILENILDVQIRHISKSYWWILHSCNAQLYDLVFINTVSSIRRYVNKFQWLQDLVALVYRHLEADYLIWCCLKAHFCYLPHRLSVHDRHKISYQCKLIYIDFLCKWYLLFLGWRAEHSPEEMTKLIKYED